MRLVAIFREMLEAQETLDLDGVEKTLVERCLGEGEDLLEEAVRAGVAYAGREAIRQMRKEAFAEDSAEPAATSASRLKRAASRTEVRSGEVLPDVSYRYADLLGYLLNAPGLPAIRLADADTERLDVEADYAQASGDSYHRKAAWLRLMGKEMRRQGRGKRVADVFSVSELRRAARSAAFNPRRRG